MSILDTIKADLVNEWHVVEHDASAVLTEAEHKLETAAATLWGDFKPLLVKVEPQVYAQLRTVIVGILSAFGSGRDAAEIETALLNVLEAGGTSLLGIAQGLGSNLLQLIINLVKAS